MTARLATLTSITALFSLGSLVPGLPSDVPDRPASGRIAGNVEISVALTPRRPQFRIYAEPGRALPPASPKDEIARELRNVVLYLDDNRGSALPARTSDSGHAVMSQIAERFEPHVVSVVQGARVEFPNNDDVYHNVFSLSGARTFDLGRYPTGASKSVTFPKRGVVQVFCHIHADMSGIVLVLPNSYHTSPQTTGQYAIENVPPGEYTIVGWHERTRPVTHRIRVEAGQTTTLDFTLPLQSASDR